MYIYTKTTIFLILSAYALAAPIRKEDTRQKKSLSYFDYVQPNDGMDYSGFEPDSNLDYNLDYDQNELSRTIPKRKRIRNRPTPNYNSPIYYIRLPPQPYMFVPGLGYVSQPPPSPVQQFLNVPVSFVANGKPANIYQWSGVQQFPSVQPPLSRPVPHVPQVPAILPQVHRPSRPTPKPTDSTIHRLPGSYSFNGKPEDIFVLRDSYNSLYSDALQNFYP